MADLGVSFIPSGDEQNSPPQGPTGAPSGVSPLQSAIKLLSLRLPRFGGQMPGALAPGGLLGAPGAAGLPGGGGPIEEVLKRLFGLQGTSPSATPMPRIVPGDRPERIAGGDDELIPGGFKPMPTFRPNAPSGQTMTAAPGPRLPRIQGY